VIGSARGTIRALALVAQLGLVVACAGAPPLPTPAGTPAATLNLGAGDDTFDSASLTAPAGAPFDIVFNIHSGSLHNLVIRQAGTTYYHGELFTGPAERTYFVPPLPAGQYEFFCEVHPNMTGTLTSQ
jgi:plastocyanin